MNEEQIKLYFDRTVQELAQLQEDIQKTKEKIVKYSGKIFPQNEASKAYQEYSELKIESQKERCLLQQLLKKLDILRNLSQMNKIADC